MKVILKIFLSIFLIITSFGISAQNNKLAQKAKDLKLYFGDPYVKLKDQNQFLTYLIVKNVSNQESEFKITLSVPKNWSVFGSSMLGGAQTLNGWDSIIIPVRIAIGYQNKGGIAYPVGASLFDSEDNLLINAQTYISIDPKSEISVSPLGIRKYFDVQTLQAYIEVKVKNKGNKEEVVNFELDLDNALDMQGAEKGLYKKDILVQYKSDTTIKFLVDLRKENNFEDKKTFKVQVNAGINDTSFKHLFVLKYLESTYINKSDNVLIPLTIEFIAQNLFQVSRPSFSVNVEGNILLNKKQKLIFDYHNFRDDDLWKYSMMHIGIKAENYHLILGDVRKSMEISLAGRGLDAFWKIGKQRFQLYATRNLIRPENIGALEYRYEVSPKVKVFTGAAYSDYKKGEITKMAVFFGNSLNNIIPRHSLSWKAGFSNEGHSQGDSINFSKAGYSSQVLYNYKGKNLNSRLNWTYGSPYYAGFYKGRSDLVFQNTLRLKNNNRLDFSFSNFSFRPHYFINNIEAPVTISHNSRMDVTYYRSFSKFTAITGALLSDAASNSFYGNLSTHNFRTTGGSVLLGGKYRNIEHSFYISNKFYIGAYSVTDFDTILKYNSKNKFVPTFSFTSLFTFRNFGNSILYYSGPYNLFQQFYLLHFNRNYGSVTISPYYQKFVYRKMIQLIVRATYTNIFTEKINRTSIITEMRCFFNKGWSLRMLNNLNVTSRGEVITGETKIYKFNYVEFAIRKEFLFDQPAIKYRNLSIIFFKDLNGNQVMDENEPGIPNVLANVASFRSDSIKKMPYELINETELISNLNGEVRLEKIPIGRYIGTFQCLDPNLGHFTPEHTSIDAVMTNHTVLQIPYYENNRIYGQIILNRAKFSALGEVELSNIKVTAIDRSGVIYSTLTDNAGKFEMYLPKKDEYTVSMPNIYSESFDLMQDKFIVSFNGFKQFEIAFILNERFRVLNIDNTNTDVEPDEEMDVVRKTNLQGSIREDKYKPIRARIQVRIKGTKTIIADEFSNELTGSFKLTFRTGENYEVHISDPSGKYLDLTEELFLNQFISFQNIDKEYILKKNKDYKEPDKKDKDDKSGYQKPIRDDFDPSTIVLHNVKFPINSASLSEKAFEDIDRLVGVMKRNKGIIVEISGHADDSESNRENKRISLQRALNVATYMRSQGITSDRLFVTAMSNRAPRNTEETNEARAMNRRVEVRMLNAQTANQ